METQTKNPLWTRNFTIITLGSVVSLCGNAISGFAMSLLVLDLTGSSFLYATFVAVYTLPQIFVPILSGTLLDRFSRRKTIYTLDYTSACLYALAGILLKLELFTFPVLVVFAFIVGCINSVYTVAYQSFYPLLITEGNFSRAYSIASVLETLAAVAVPISAFAYNRLGIVPLMFVNTACFFIAATAETQIRAEEKYTKEAAAPVNGQFRQMLTDTKEGFRYLASEKGLLCIGVYFFFCSMGGGASSVITLPYFKGNFSNGEYIYMLVMGMSVLGRGLGGLFHYRRTIPARHKFTIALFVYLLLSVNDGFYLYFSLPVMMVIQFIDGLTSVTSYTIRISSTQSYVPDGKKGRFNGAFTLLSTLGSFAGEMAAGALAEFFPMRPVLAGFMLLNGLAAAVFIGGGKKHVKQIYNRQS